MPFASTEFSNRANVDPFPEAVRGRCPNDRLRAAGVNEAVWTSVRDLLLDSDAFAQEMAAWVERQTTTPSDQDARTRKIEARIEELTRQRDRLTDAYQTGALALDPFRARIQALDANHAAAELALAEIKTKHLEVELVRSRALGAQEVISTLRTKLLDADFDTQQTILRLLVERVVVHGQSLEIHLALPVSSNSALTSKHLQEAEPPELGIPRGAGACAAQRRADRSHALSPLIPPPNPSPTRALQAMLGWELI